MYHYDAGTALEELQEDALLPNPVHIRDMIIRSQLNPDQALELNRRFQTYLHSFGEAQQIAKQILEQLAVRSSP
jgi:hypothetical protein